MTKVDTAWCFNTTVFMPGKQWFFGLQAVFIFGPLTSALGLLLSSFVCCHCCRHRLLLCQW